MPLLQPFASPDHVFCIIYQQPLLYTWQLQSTCVTARLSSLPILYGLRYMTYIKGHFSHPAASCCFHFPVSLSSVVQLIGVDDMLQCLGAVKRFQWNGIHVMYW